MACDGTCCGSTLGVYLTTSAKRGIAFFAIIMTTERSNTRTGAHRTPQPRGAQAGGPARLSALPRKRHTGSSTLATQPVDDAIDARLSTADRIERALVLLAYFIELDGDVHVPLFEKFEAELQALRQAEDTRARARQLLSAYSRSGGLKAICDRNLSLSSSEGPSPNFGL